MPFHIVPLAEDHTQGLNDVANAIIAEKEYMVSDEPEPLEKTLKLVSDSLQNKTLFFVAMDKNRVVGSCAINRFQHPNRAHDGNLGISLLASHRNKGLGTLLLRHAIEAAWQGGMTRISLGVFTTNERAIHLYEKHGFEREGLYKNFALINGVYRHSVLMALHH